MSMKLQNLLMPARQPIALRIISDQIGLTVSETMRRMVDYCLRPEVFYEVIPAVSGMVRMPTPQQIQQVACSGSLKGND